MLDTESRWYCAHCGLPSSCQGHYTGPNIGGKCPNTVNAKGWGFSCPKNHTCRKDNSNARSSDSD